MKNRWLLALVLVGCATNDKPDIDPTGTVSTTLTWGGGNCAKTGVCAEVCVADAQTTCWHGGGICVTFSQQVPQCIPRLD